MVKQFLDGAKSDEKAQHLAIVTDKEVTLLNLATLQTFKICNLPAQISAVFLDKVQRVCCW